MAGTGSTRKSLGNQGSAIDGKNGVAGQAKMPSSEGGPYAKSRGGPKGGVVDKRIADPHERKNKRDLGDEMTAR